MTAELNITKRDVLGFFLLLVIIVMEVNISFQNYCPTAIIAQHGHALSGSEYESFTTTNYATCMMQCDNDDRCMSVNFHLVTKTCDLNTQTKESRPACYQTRANSMYTTNMAFRTPKLAKSCREIKVSCNLQGSGEYWIDLEQKGSPIRVLCDMTTDGGGWTIVKKTVLQSSQVPINKIYESYEVLTAYNINEVNVIPTSKIMLKIKFGIGFHQIHFYCHKKSVGRVISIMTRNNTAGQQVVRFFTDDTYAKSTFPAACDSFDRLPEDTSVLSQNCQRWGKDESKQTEVNKWGFPVRGGSRMTSRPFLIDENPKHYYGIYNNGKSLNWCRCDDFETESCAANDTWMIAVR